MNDKRVVRISEDHVIFYNEHVIKIRQDVAGDQDNIDISLDKFNQIYEHLISEGII